MHFGVSGFRYRAPASDGGLEVEFPSAFRLIQQVQPTFTRISFLEESRLILLAFVAASAWGCESHEIWVAI